MTDKPQEAPAPEMLDAADLAYHTRMIREMEALQYAWNFWVRFLADKHHLGPQDQILPDGTILRGAKLE